MQLIWCTALTTTYAVCWPPATPTEINICLILLMPLLCTAWKHVLFLAVIKTGESGMTVFRLLSKSSGWVWVKANAKLIYKGGRPDFIIAYQRALVWVFHRHSLVATVATFEQRVLKLCHWSYFSNAEGEEYLRQRRLQLPFSFTTGEAVLYDTGPTVDISQFQFNKMFTSGDTAKNVAPGSLLDSFLKQDETVYTNTSDSPLPVDQVFMNSRALLSIPSDAWPENGAASVSGVLKVEAKQSMMTVINNLENGDLCSVLQSLDAEDPELTHWENALNRLSQSEDHAKSVGSQLESIFMSDIFDYINSILFKENAENLNGTHPSCISTVNHQQGPFNQMAAGLCEPLLFPTPSPDCAYSPHSQQQETPSTSAIAESNQTFNNTRKLSHLPPGVEAVPAQLTVPDASATFQSCGQLHVGFPTEPSQPSRQILLHPQTGLQSNGELLQSTVEQQLVDILSPLVPCADVKCQMPACPSIVLENASLWQNNIPKLTPGQQGGLACSRASTQSSCMFEQHFSCIPTGGDVTTLSGSSGLRWADVYMDQSPPQGSCYFQYSHSEPVVGTSVISQEDARVSPLSHPSTAASSDPTFNIQHYLDYHRQTRIPPWDAKQLQNEEINKDSCTIASNCKWTGL